MPSVLIEGNEMTYNTKVYTEQGGDRFVVKSGGVISMESGAQILFGTAQAAALNTVSVSALTTTGIASLSTAQTSNLTTTQLSALCTNNDLSATAIAALQTDVNAIKVALKNVGILASS